MNCEQAINIIDYIFLHRLQEDDRCTKKKSEMSIRALLVIMLRHYAGPLNNLYSLSPAWS